MTADSRAHQPDAERGQRFGKSWFLEDYRNFAACLGQRGLRTVCDFSVDSIFLRTVRKFLYYPETLRNIDALVEIRLERRETILLELSLDASLSWLTCGTPFGVALHEQQVRDALPPGTLVGIASASAMNGGYSGITLYQWTNDEQADRSGFGRKIAGFYGGQIKVWDTDQAEPVRHRVIHDQVKRCRRQP